MMAICAGRAGSGLLALAIGLLAATYALAGTGQHKVMRVYHIGNSLTRSITLDRLHMLMDERGIDYQFGSQLLGGCSLARHWRTRRQGEWTRNWESNKPAGDTFEPGEPDSDSLPKRFGPYDQALRDFQWDALVLQPVGNGTGAEFQAMQDFISFALEHGATKHVFLYSTWCGRPAIRDEAGRRTGVQSIDYQALWERTPPGEDADEARSLRQARHEMMARVNAAFAGKLEEPVRIIPMGEVFCELDKRLKAGQIPGLAELCARAPERIPGWDPQTGAAAGANILYADGIHPVANPHLDGNISNYTIALTHCAVLTGKSPMGLSGRAYGLDDEEDATLIKALQGTVWDVVTNHPYAGIRQDESSR